VCAWSATQLGETRSCLGRPAGRAPIWPALATTTRLLGAGGGEEEGKRAANNVDFRKKETRAFACSRTTGCVCVLAQAERKAEAKQAA
jgi:hypothetical protein